MSLEEAPIQSFVFEATARAFASFDALTQAQQGLRGDNDINNNNNNNSQTLHIAILDNSSRFNIWVGNIGARYPAADPRSADHRLRDAPRPASRILDILRDLCETNHELLNILLGHRQDASNVDVEDAEDDSDHDEAFDLEVVENPISEAHELCLTVADSITSLMKVSVLIRKATPRDKYAKAAAKKAMPEWTLSDRSHVGDKFPKAKDQRWLVERLGDAITARRQFLRYSQEHHERLAGETGGKHDVSGRSALNATVTATAASTLDFEMIQSRNLHQMKDDDDSYSQAYSRVTYAAAVDSPLKFSSLESVAKDRESGRHTCSRIFEHTFARSKVAKLDLLKREALGSATSWKFIDDSGIAHHAPAATGSTILLIIVRSIVDGNSTPITQYSVHDACAFCNDLLSSTSHHTASGNRDQVKVVSVTKLKEHIATHLEQLALFALPPTDENIGDTDEDEDATRDTAPLPQQHADLVRWQQNVLSEEIDTVGQTSISNWAPPTDLEAQVHFEPTTSTFHLPGDERVHEVGRDEPAAWFYSQSAKRKYRFSKSKNAYVWEDGTLVAQQQPPAPSRPSTGAHPVAIPTSKTVPATASWNALQSDPSRTDELTSSLGRLAFAPRDDQQTQRSKGRPSATETEVSALREVGRGVREFTATDKDAGVQTNWRIGPAQNVGERQFTPKTIRGGDDGNGASDEEEDRQRGSSGKGRVNSPAYSTPCFLLTLRSADRSTTRALRRNFTFGQVIELVLVPPPPSKFSEISSAVTIRPGTPGTSQVRGGAHAAVRRFVVVQPATDPDSEFSAIPIRTYDGDGVAGEDDHGRSIVKAHHAIIYTANPIRPPAPFPTAAESPRMSTNGTRERGMQYVPILVDELDRTRPLDPMSRLDFFDVHNFDTSLQNIRVYGDVHRDSQLPLRTQYMAVQALGNRSAEQGRLPGPPGPPPGPSPGPPPPRLVQEAGRAYVERPTQQSRQTSAPTPDASAISTAVHSNAAISVNVLMSYLNNLHHTVTARGLDPPQALTQMQLQHLAANSTARMEYLSRLRSNWQRATGPARRR
ncbi:hypothetical protein LTR27_008717 [Elasticomyces elasticus]|nr:hypothetical protein LTR27_008717 [Elasticomyces elasticus]